MNIETCVSFVPQIFVWTGSFFSLHQTLNFQQNILSLAPFARAGVPYLLVCVDSQTLGCRVLQWTGGRFQNPQGLPVAGRAMRVEVINTRADGALLLIAVEGDQTVHASCGCDNMLRN